jgi:hypothetical protein
MANPCRCSIIKSCRCRSRLRENVVRWQAGSEGSIRQSGILFGQSWRSNPSSLLLSLPCLSWPVQFRIRQVSSVSSSREAVSCGSVRGQAGWLRASRSVAAWFVAVLSCCTGDQCNFLVGVRSSVLKVLRPLPHRVTVLARRARRIQSGRSATGRRGERTHSGVARPAAAAHNQPAGVNGIGESPVACGSDAGADA